MIFLWLVAAAIFLSYCFTWMVRRYALARRRLIDVPNERSSHHVVTPRGGGLAIVLAFTITTATLGFAHDTEPTLLLALFLGGGLIALVSFIDDHRHLTASFRLLTHFLAAACAVAMLYVPSSRSQELTGTPLDWLIVVVAIVLVVWLVNLYNFMDGIDGIASIEAITVSIGGAMVFYIADPTGQLWMTAILLSASVAGFLCWNYPPARIFMGDVGSGFLGFVFALFSLKAAWLGPNFLVAWAILLGVFVVDSGVALLRRLLRGERLHEAHRSHAYQYAAREHQSHARVSLAVGVVNAVWLVPLAVLVSLSIVDRWAGLTLAYAPLLWLAWRYKSGTIEARTA